MTRSFLFSVVISTAVACGNEVAVPELDNQIIDTAGIAGTTSANVLQRLGEPSAKRLNGTRVEWSYAIRAFQSGHGYRRAAILRIEFSRAGVVSDWYFLDPQAVARLPIRESLSGAKRYLARICRQPVPEVNLQLGIRNGHTTSAEILSLLEPVARFTHRREIPIKSGMAWDYDVDRPSPLFIPPFYIKIAFGDQYFGSPGIAHRPVPEGYGGCI